MQFMTHEVMFVLVRILYNQMCGKCVCTSIHALSHSLSANTDQLRCVLQTVCSTAALL